MGAEATTKMGAAFKGTRPTHPTPAPGRVNYTRPMHPDVRAAEAVALFCYQTMNWIGAHAAALVGVDTLIFAGGIGENAPVIRVRICESMEFFGIEIEEMQNAVNEGVISTQSSRVAIRVIRTVEELMIARSDCRALGLG